MPENPNIPEVRGELMDEARPANITPIIPPPAPPVVTALDSPDDVPKFWCTWDAYTDEGLAMALRCFSGCEGNAGEYLNQEFVVKGVFAHAVQLPDKVTGELIDVPRIVLVLEDDKLLACCSWGVLKAVRLILSVRKIQKKNGPFRATLKVIETNNSHRMYTLFLIPEPPAKKGGKNG